MDDDLVKKAKNALERNLGRATAAPNIQYNILVPVSAEQAEKILRILEEEK